MKRFLLGVFTVIALCCIVDFVCGKILDKAFFEMPNTTSQTAQTNWFINKVETDVVILGSSRAAHHYVPSILADSLGMSVYNCGREGMGFVFNSCILERILSRYTPRLVILDVAESYFRGDTKYRLSALNPYYGTSDYIKSALNEINGSTNWVKMRSRLYRYNGCFLKLVNGYHSPIDSNSGFIPLTGSFRNGNWIVPEDASGNNEPDEMEMRHFKDIITMCKEHDIPLVVVVSPHYGNGENILKISGPVCEQNGVPCIIDNYLEGFSDDQAFFRDESHINKEGAAMFSKILAGQIKDVLASNR